jgi:KUP system potassium uptake protein
VTLLGAIEGLAIAAPHLEHWVVPITVLVLVALFALQRRGTAAVGLILDRFTLLWFFTRAVLGLVHIVDAPQILLEWSSRTRRSW